MYGPKAQGRSGVLRSIKIHRPLSSTGCPELIFPPYDGSQLGCKYILSVYACAQWRWVQGSTQGVGTPRSLSDISEYYSLAFLGTISKKYLGYQLFEIKSSILFRVSLDDYQGISTTTRPVFALGIDCRLPTTVKENFLTLSNHHAPRGWGPCSSKY